MRISKTALLNEAESTGFRPEMLEKCIHLLNLLEALRAHPFLRGRLALKGGSALNLFVFNVPRLSVDIDLNYVGAADVEVMKRERPKVERAIRDVCENEGLVVESVPGEHAGGRWTSRYESALEGGGDLELDMNFLLRIPLWPVTQRDSKPLGSYMAKGIPVVDIHELAAGKLAALLARHASRDLFDAHILLTQAPLDAAKLRLGFVVYGAGNRKDWRTVTPEDVDFEPRELLNRVIPLMRERQLDEVGDVVEWAKGAVRTCREALSCVLPLSDQEMAFLNALMDKGQIEPLLITQDEDMVRRIMAHPLLNWKAVNVRKHKGLR